VAGGGACGHRRADSENLIVRLSPRQRAAVKRAAERIGVLDTLYNVRRWRDARTAGTDVEGNDLPPPSLRSLVGGTPDAAQFVAAGRSSAAALYAAAIEKGFDFDDASVEILDFGCGCGRTSRHWRRPIYGTDIRPELVAWCQQHLPGVYGVNDPEPPTLYSNASFDVVYAVSVFTHLTEERQQRWLAEFARIIRNGGLLLLTTHGDRLAAENEALTDAELRTFRAGRIVVCYPRQEGSNVCVAYHPAGSLARLTDDFDVADRIPEALHRHDIHVLVRRTKGAAAPQEGAG
jgi:SAM-dependent methyltransferase